MTELEKLFFIDEKTFDDVFLSGTKTHVKSLETSYTENQDDGGLPLFNLALVKAELKRTTSPKSFYRSLWQELLEECIEFENEDLTEENFVTTIELLANKIAVKTRRGRSNVIMMSEKTFEVIQDYHVPVNWLWKDDQLIELSNKIPDGYIMIMYINTTAPDMTRAIDRPIHCWEQNDKLWYGYIPGRVRTHTKMISIPLD